MIEHHRGSEQLRRRIGDPLPRDVRRRAVHRLEDRGVAADVGARRQAQSADHARAEVGDDVAVQVRAAEDVVLARPKHQLHAHVVHDAVFELDVLVLLRDLARDREEQPIGVLHDVRLVHGGDLAPLVVARVVERKLDDAL